MTQKKKERHGILKRFILDYNYLNKLTTQCLNGNIMVRLCKATYF